MVMPASTQNRISGGAGFGRGGRTGGLCEGSPPGDRAWAGDGSTIGGIGIGAATATAI